MIEDLIDYVSLMLNRMYNMEKIKERNDCA